MKVDKKVAAVDISQYENFCGNLSHWQGVEARVTESLRELNLPQRAAEQMLTLGDDCPPDDRRQAEAVLAKCEEESADLQRRLDIVHRQIVNIKAQLAPMLLEAEKQNNLRTLARYLRSVS